jgi:glycosyltransferase involved in cell wall biosynthesis
MLKNKLLRAALQIGGRLIDIVIAQTEFMRKDIINYYKLPASKIRTIRNIVDINHIKSQSEYGSAPELQCTNYNILSVGALYSVKGFDILIEAISPIIKEMSSVHLYIIGTERYESGYCQVLQEQINNLGLCNNVHLLGQKSNPFPYFKAANLFVLSSRKEGYPNVVLEALALNTPVVATNVVDFSNVIKDGVNGYVVQKNSVDSLRTGIRKAIQERDYLKPQDTIDNFDFKKLFSHYDSRNCRDSLSD